MSWIALFLLSIWARQIALRPSLLVQPFSRVEVAATEKGETKILQALGTCCYATTIFGEPFDQMPQLGPIRHGVHVRMGPGALY